MNSMISLSVCVGVRLASTDHVCSRSSGSMLGTSVFSSGPFLTSGAAPEDIVLIEELSK